MSTTGPWAPRQLITTRRAHKTYRLNDRHKRWLTNPTDTSDDRDARKAVNLLGPWKLRLVLLLTLLLPLLLLLLLSWVSNVTNNSVASEPNVMSIVTSHAAGKQQRQCLTLLATIDPLWLDANARWRRKRDLCRELRCRIFHPTRFLNDVCCVFASLPPALLNKLRTVERPRARKGCCLCLSAVSQQQHRQRWLKKGPKPATSVETSRHFPASRHSL